jgi:NADH-quinone oxidoreductase subunit M
MFVLTHPLLTIIAILGFGLLYSLIIGANRPALVGQVCLFVSLAALAVGIAAVLSFDKAAAGYQFMTSFSLVSTYNTSLSLGVDGLSFVFLILTLITFPVLFLTA